MVKQPIVGQSPLIVDAARLDSLRHTTFGGTLLDERSARHRDLHSQETDIRAPGGIRNHTPNKRAARDPRLRLRGHLDRLDKCYTHSFINHS